MFCRAVFTLGMQPNCAIRVSKFPESIVRFGSRFFETYNFLG